MSLFIDQVCLTHRTWPKFFVVKVLIVVLLFLLNGCAAQQKNTDPIVWPKPPAEARVIYESTLRNQASLTPETREDRMRRVVTGRSELSVRALSKPYDVAAQGGLVAISDSVLSVVHIFDVPRKRLFQIGWRGEGKLSKPLGVAIDKAQQIYVVDAGRGHVVKYDKQGHYLDVIGQRKDFSRIIDVAVDENSGRVYVLDRGGVESIKHRVVVYSAAGERIQVIGTRGHEPGKFNHPNQLAVDTEGQLFVLDAGNFRVQVFDNQGVYLRNWGRLGRQMGDLARPRGLAVDQQNNVYVTDSVYQNFQIFNQLGQLLLSVGGGGVDAPGQYALPAGIALDETGRIYVVDQMRRKVDIFRLLAKTSVDANAK